MRRAIVTLSSTLLLGLLPGIPGGSAGAAPDSGGSHSADFNGDGFDDLAVGIPYESLGGKNLAGAVNILYGTAVGLSAQGSQLWHQDSPGILDRVDSGDYFGTVLAPEDFNGDGFSDLAIAVRDEDVGSQILAGAVAVLYGSPAGLAASGNQLWSRDSPGVRGSAGIADEFGYSLAAGDFNGDGFADLAAGTPSDRVNNRSYAGSFNVLYGSAAGLTATGNQLWSQDSPGVEDQVEDDDGFGSFLSSGDFNGDGVSDIAVGAGHEGLGDIDHAGAVNVLFGSAGGLLADGDQFWHQDSPGILGEADHDEDFGWFSISAGDFDGDGFADLAVGLFGEEVNGASLAGAVNVLYGSSTGLSAEGNQLWNQDSPGVESDADIVERFGYDLASGDFDGDGYCDLGVGVYGERVRANNAGAVNVLYGSATGLSSDRDQFWHQDSPGIADVPEDGDYFGTTIAAGDWGNGPEADLAVGAIYETIVGDGGYEGAVQVIYGAAAEGLIADGSQFWHQGVPGIPEQTEPNDFYGYDLA
jgi:disulfide bond formation protein DsbB